MFDRVQKDYSVNSKNSYMIGDKCSDINFGRNVGLISILIKSKKYDISDCEFDFIRDDLLKTSKWILKNKNYKNKKIIEINWIEFNLLELNL